TGNTIDGFATGIYLNRGHNMTLMNNTIEHSQFTGLQVFFAVTGNSIASNLITGSGVHGIEVDGNFNALSKNIVSQNTEEGIYVFTATGCMLTSNVTNNNGDSGIVLNEAASSNVLTGNTANFNHFVGIALEGSSNLNKLTGNTTNFNNTGLYISESNTNT